MEADCHPLVQLNMAIHIEPSPSEAADRLAIRELFDAYAHCADRRDAEGQNAVHGPHPVRGVDGRPRHRADLCVRR